MASFSLLGIRSGMVAGNRGTKGRRGVENEGVGFGHPKAFPIGLLDLGLSRNDGGVGFSVRLNHTTGFIECWVMPGHYPTSAMTSR